MKLIATITDKEICGTDEVSHAAPRRAVRAILLNRNGDMALLHIGKYDVYTVPGGGVEPQEDLETALRREMMEETGCMCGIEHELGLIRESRALHDFTQESHYYLARVVGEQGLPAMTQEEIEEETHVHWYSLEKALELVTHAKHDDYQRRYIQARDIAVIREAMAYLHSV